MTENSGNPSNPSATPAVSPESPATRPAEPDMRPKERETFIMKALADHQSSLIGYANTILHDLDLARDVVQDTFFRLCQQDLRAVEAHLKAWLFTVCRNRALDVLRKDKRTQPLEDIRWKKVAGAGLQPDEMAAQGDISSRLQPFLGRLSENQREVILLKFGHDLSYREIHEITGLTTTNIGFLIHSGIKRLREILPADLRP
ncbi:MAG: sigma-70 family RNA polymerase sigma factor [Verrucomicrobiota bacterium]